jgi:4-diphosphocytidyl-2-C-methyl-D-erythritol kinase
VSTGQAFRDLDARMASLLTFQQAADRLEQLSRVLAGAYTVSGQANGPTGIFRTALPASGSELLSSEESRSTANDRAENTLLALVRTGIENDFEEVAFSQHPSLRDIKRALLGSPSALPNGSTAFYAALSGSGSALFGLYKTAADADAAQQRVRETGAQALRTETLPRSAYWKQMFAE